MSDFCKACSIVLFGKDFKDLANITTKEAIKEKRATLVLCEGCGVIQVNVQGECLSRNCLKDGQKGHGLRDIVEETQ